MSMEDIEGRRLLLQVKLDSEKTSAERNELGQFATPTLLARDILRYANTLLPERACVRFFDPAVGTGSFYSALLSEFSKDRIEEAVGCEVDPHYGKPASEFWAGSNLSIRSGDFTRMQSHPRYNLLICNPPYVRHHHIDSNEKARLQIKSLETCGVRIGGLAGLYCYFLALSHAWLADNAVAGWLVPSEFMDVNYGQAVKRYLLDRVTLLRIHRFDPKDVQFADALVSSAVVWFRNVLPPREHNVEFTFGGTVTEPKVSKSIPISALSEEAKWSRFPISNIRSRSAGPILSDFFKVKRGVATGDNSYFILDENNIKQRQLPFECFKPILPSPRYVKVNEIDADQRGLPLLDRRLFLLDPGLSEREIEKRYPALAAYLDEGKRRGLPERYLCRHRAVWYGQENRPAAPIVCTYLGRGDLKSGRPFRFILNHSQATVANVYLAMYPTPMFLDAISRDPSLMRRAWVFLNQISPERLLGEGRVYGGGLHKLEPKELANVPVPELAALMPMANFPEFQKDLFVPAAE